MAVPRLFRLKSEVAPAPVALLAHESPFAQIRVDTGVFHLDQLFDYAIPESLSSVAVMGVRVQVPFSGREVEGIIVRRTQIAQRAGAIKSITKILSIHPIATEQSLALIDRASEVFCGNTWDIIRSAIPPRTAAVDKSYESESKFFKNSMKNKKPIFLNLRPFTPAHQQLNELVRTQSRQGSVLIIAPDEKDVRQIRGSLEQEFDEVLSLTASMGRDDRYRSYLDAMNRPLSIVVGTRSAVFAPVSNLGTIIIFKESSIDHQEIRSPGWNSAAIAALRSEMEGLDLILTGFSPSICISMKIDQGGIKYLNAKGQVSVKSFDPVDGALLPGRIFTEIRKSLSKGPVLFLAPRKGYGNALLCAHCRNIAQCGCGGRLSVLGKSLPPTCVHCGKDFKDWRCTYCGKERQYLAGRGIDRASEEIARAFPGFPIYLSQGDHIKEEIDSKPSIVLSTPGSQPHVDGGYSAVVVLDAARFFSHTGINAQEIARELIFETASLVSVTGQVLLVIDGAHPITSGIARWNVAPMLKRELADRSELGLPPFSSSAVLVMSKDVATQIGAGLRKAVQEARLPESTRIFGPTLLPNDQAKIVIHVDISQSHQMCAVLHELQRRRSIAKKDLFTLRIDPYSL